MSNKKSDEKYDDDSDDENDASVHMGNECCIRFRCVAVAFRIPHEAFV